MSAGKGGTKSSDQRSTSLASRSTENSTKASRAWRILPFTHLSSGASLRRKQAFLRQLTIVLFAYLVAVGNARPLATNAPGMFGSQGFRRIIRMYLCMAEEDGRMPPISSKWLES